MALLLLHDGQAGHHGRLLLVGGYLATSRSKRARVLQKSSVIDLAEHDVHGADDGDGVGNHVAAAHLVERRQVGKPGARIFRR
jgi:hypothetical protein